jgi:hypothetical protein
MKAEQTKQIISENPVSIPTVIITCFLSLAAYAAQADEARVNEALVDEDSRWSLALDKDGVRIYTRDYEGSDVKAFKADTILNAPITNIMSVMANPRSCLEWVHGCSVSYGFDEESFNKRYAYSVNDLPWPVQDRDYVLEINTTSLAGGDKIMMEMHAVEGRKPVSDGYVRTTIAQTIYEFRPTSDNKTQMLWLQHTEPAGVLPSWLVNNLLVDIPYKSLKTLEEVAQWEQYQNSRIVYDENGIISGVTSSVDTAEK